MKCIIPSANFRILGKAINTLSKIGDELYVEPHKEGVYFRSVNSGRSAFASIKFSRSFFTFYTADDADANNTADTVSTLVDVDDEVGEPVKCKVAMKCVLGVFRTQANQVECCQLQLENDGGQLVFQLSCRHSVRKSHYIPIIECEAVQAVYNKENVPNKFNVQSRVICDVMQTFQKNHEEISFMVCPSKIIVRNFSDGTLDTRKSAVRSEVTMVPLDFDILNIELDSTVTFSLGELKALLLFTEATNLPLEAYFEDAGKPIIFTTRSISFEFNLVLATMTTQSDSQVTSQMSAAQSTTGIQRRKRPHENGNANSSTVRQIADPGDDEDEERMELEQAEANLDADYAAQQVQPLPAGTPPHVKAQRYYFPRCFQSTQEIGRPQHAQVLCPDSDSEESEN